MSCIESFTSQVEPTGSGGLAVCAGCGAVVLVVRCGVADMTKAADPVGIRGLEVEPV
ncbi:MAG: hypothetical protein V9G19_24890 [Tetrasphaera sp.]